MNKKRLLHMGLALLGLIPTAAEAQSLVAGQGVADRARPDYDPVGSRVGAFTLYPTVTTTAAATNNYLATDTDQRGDAYLYVQPDLLVRSDLARQQFEGHIFVNQSVHASLSGDDSTQYGASANDSFDVSHDTQFRVNGSAGRFVESRASLGTFQDAAEPVKFEVYHAGIGASHSFTDLTIGGDFSGEYRNYNNTKLFDGTPVDQSYRDVRELTASGSAQYALRNGIGLIVSGQYNDEHYSFGPGSAGFIPNNSINRDSTGFNIDAGVTLELTHLILGHVEVGYLSRSYNDPQLSNFGGIVVQRRRLVECDPHHVAAFSCQSFHSGHEFPATCRLHAKRFQLQRRSRTVSLCNLVGQCQLWQLSSKWHRCRRQ